MGHAHHFLSRLDRVSLPHVELALGLYRDEGLLRYVLERARVPEGAERVALSLDHPEDGPFLIVTRGGRFVTCLGAGMKAGDLPVITRGQLDAIAAKAGELRERMAAATALAGGGGVRALLRRIYEAADELTREDFLAISALQPLYAHDFLRLYLGAATDLEDARHILLRTLRKTDRLRPAYKEALRTYWQTLWALGHLAVLSAMDGAAPLPQEILSSFEGATLSWPTTRQGVLSIALRGAWATARLGKPMLGAYKHFYHQAVTFLQTIDGGLGLSALGLRHARLRAEVDKALTTAIPADFADTRWGNYLRALRDAARTFHDLERREPELLRKLHRDFGAKAWMTVTQALPRGAPLRFERAEDVPEPLALTTGVNVAWTFFHGAGRSADVMMWLFAMLPWVARAAPEELYFPREAQRAIHAPWSPELTLGVLRELRDHEDAMRRAAPPAGPTRSGPCPCGSGKKYKRCCGAGQREA